MSIGKDLASIRKKQGLTLEEIQSSIKIPLPTLKEIENDSIFEDYETNKTYVRSFVRSFARTLQIPEEDIVEALDAYENNTYSGSLLTADDTRTTQDSDSDSVIVNEEEREPGFDLSNVKAPDIEEVAPGTPSVKNVNWADMGKKFSLHHSTRKVRITVISVVTLLLILLVSGYFFWDTLTGTPEDEVATTTDKVDEEEPSIVAPLIPSTPVDSSTTQNETTPSGSEEEISVENTDDIAEPDETEILPEGLEGDEAETMPVNREITSENMQSLPDTLTLLVYAAFDKLEPVRVTSDLNWRTNPFWMEKGLAYKFDFSDSVLVKGQYSRMLLLFNGHVIEDPLSSYFSEEFDSILLTRDDLDQPFYMRRTDVTLPEDTDLPENITYGIRY